MRTSTSISDGVLASFALMVVEPASAQQQHKPNILGRQDYACCCTAPSASTLRAPV
jgi:hypothetical protein